MRGKQIKIMILFSYFSYDYFPIFSAPKKYSGCLMIKDTCKIMFLKWKQKRHDHMIILHIFNVHDVTIEEKGVKYLKRF